MLVGCSLAQIAESPVRSDKGRYPQGGANREVSVRKPGLGKYAERGDGRKKGVEISGRLESKIK